MAPLAGWQSRGGAGRLHPLRAFPSSMRVAFGQEVTAQALVLRGCLAQFAAPRHESIGTVGAEITAGGFTLKLVNGRHYGDASAPGSIDRVNGDGTKVFTVGTLETQDGSCRVDELRIDLLRPVKLDSLVFRSFDTPSSFVFYEVLAKPVEMECPFRGKGSQISLSEVGSIVRLRDWERFEVAVGQLHRGLAAEGELDDAKGSVLTFLAVVSSAILDFGGNRKLHRFQLDSARRLDELQSVDAVALEACRLCQDLVGEYLPAQRNHTTAAIDRALRIIESRFSQDVADDDVAEQVGLSTSHFRHLFKERTGVPYQKYLLNLRLERARHEIMASGVPIRQIAEECGFVSPAHFSRAFSQRFGMPPKQLRESV